MAYIVTKNWNVGASVELYDAMITELQKELMDVIQDIQELLNKSEKLCKQYSINIPSYG